MHTPTTVALIVGLAIASGKTLHAKPALHDDAARPAAGHGATSAPAGHARAKVPHRQVGKASFYADSFAGRKMADGKRMDPNDSNAASRTLPLGTKARVTNLDTGRSAVVTIEDRGPYVDGRIVDLSPATAQQIGLQKKQGVAPVEVVPLQVPSQTVATDEPAR